ncbi:MAG: hypothetical protein Q9159_005197 [Coniocarpon cinnabarinum]
MSTSTELVLYKGKSRRFSSRRPSPSPPSTPPLALIRRPATLSSCRSQEEDAISKPIGSYLVAEQPYEVETDYQYPSTGGKYTNRSSVRDRSSRKKGKQIAKKKPIRAPTRVSAKYKSRARSRSRSDNRGTNENATTDFTSSSDTDEGASSHGSEGSSSSICRASSRVKNTPFFTELSSPVSSQSGDDDSSHSSLSPCAFSATESDDYEDSINNLYDLEPLAKRDTVDVDGDMLAGHLRPEGLAGVSTSTQESLPSSVRLQQVTQQKHKIPQKLQSFNDDGFSSLVVTSAYPGSARDTSELSARLTSVEPRDVVPQGGFHWE